MEDMNMNDSGARPSVESDNRVANVLTARKTLSEHDFFHIPRKQIQGDLPNLLKLGDDQQNVLANLGQAPNGITVTQGYPGTGKTHTIVETCVPFTLMPEQGIHLVLCPSEQGANDIALRIDARI